jgi:SLOG family YspA-like protein
MRLLVCGSRSWSNLKLMHAYVSLLGPSLIIHGGARGADLMSGEVAKRLGIPFLVYPADWKHNGIRAGFIRNQQMLNEGKPDHVLACWDGKSRGTVDMMERTRKANIPLTVINPDSQMPKPTLHNAGEIPSQPSA